MVQLPLILYVPWSVFPNVLGLVLPPLRGSWHLAAERLAGT